MEIEHKMQKQSCNQGKENRNLPQNMKPSYRSKM